MSMQDVISQSNYFTDFFPPEKFWKNEILIFLHILGQTESPSCNYLQSSNNPIWRITNVVTNYCEGCSSVGSSSALWEPACLHDTEKDLR